MNTRSRVSVLTAALGMLCVAAGAQAQSFAETEPNSQKSDANLFVFTTAGDGTLGSITGNSTGVATGASSVATSADYFRVRVPSATPGIYRYQFAVTSAIAGNQSTIRSLTQTASGITAGTDMTNQTSNGTTPVPWSNVFYAFGTAAELYYRVTGTVNTTAGYTATLSRTTVTPTVVSTQFKPGPITISTMFQTTANTEFLVLKSDFTPVPTFKNEDESVLGGGTGETSQSLCTRTLVPGTYYIAIALDNTNDSEPAATDDDVRTSTVMDFPGVVVCNSLVQNANVSLTIADGCNTVFVPQTRVAQFDVNFIQFTVAASAPDVPCVVLAESSDPAPGGSTQKFFATVTPASSGNTAITSVVADLSSVGGGANVVMSNDGLTNGDVAVDDVWTAQQAVSYHPAQFLWKATMTDADGRSTTQTATLDLSPVAPGNDECATAAPLTNLPVTVSIGNNQATHDPDVTCNTGNQAFNSIWFSYTPSVACFLPFLESTTQDVVFVVYDACGGTQIACDTTELGTTGVALSSGTTYYIMVSRSANASTVARDFYTLTFNCVPLPAPANDDCATAEVITTLPFTPASVLNGGAAHDIDTSCNAATNPETRNGIWYSYLATADCFADMSETTTQDVVISAWTGSCGSLTEVFCTNNEANVGFPMVGGTQYYFLIGRNSSSVSANATEAIAFRFDACVALPPPPANDLCSGAKAVLSFPYNDTVSIASATSDANNPSCNTLGTTEARYGIWYTITPSSNIGVQFNETAPQDTVLTLFTGTCGQLQEVVCYATETSVLNLFALQGGTQYYLLVSRAGASSVDTSTAAYTLNLTSFTLAPNDECADAIDLTSGVTLTNGTTEGATASQTAPLCFVPSLDVFYRFIPPVSGAYRVTMDPNIVSTLTIGSSCTPFDDDLACVAASSAVLISPVLELTSGTPIYMRVGNTSGISTHTIVVDQVTAGACCNNSTGACSLVLPGSCAAATSTYQGDNTVCSTASCPTWTIPVAVPCAVEEGQVFSTVYRYTNAGPAAAENVVATFNLPPIFGFTNSFPSGTFASGTLTVDLGTVAPTTLVDITLTGLGTLPGGTASIAASVESDDFLPLSNQQKVTISTPSTRHFEVLLQVQADSASFLPPSGSYGGGNVALEGAAASEQTFSRPYRSPDGSRWIMISNSNAGHVILAGTHDPFTFEVVAQEGVSQITPGELCGNFDYHAIGINDSGQFCFSTTTNAPTNNDVVVRGQVGVSGFTVIARENDPAPAIGGGAAYGSTNMALAIRNNGGVVFQSILTTGLGGVTAANDTAIFDNSGATVLAREGTMTPTGGIGAYETFNLPTQADPGHVLAALGTTTHYFRANLLGATTADDVTVFNGAVDLAEGSSTGGVTVGNILGDTLTPSGNRLSYGTSSVASDDWVILNSAVVGRNDFPIYPGSTLFWNDDLYADCFFGATGNGAGQYVIAGTFESAGDTIANALIASPTTSTIVAMENDMIDINNNGFFDDDRFISTFRNDRFFLTDDGWLYFVTRIRNSCTTTTDIGAAFVRTRIAANENCCRGTTCISVTAGSCTGVVAGSNSVSVGTCTGNTNAGCCFGDYDHNGTKDITDIFTFLNAWFSASNYADITSNGANTPDITDIFTFLNAWFGTCS